MGVFYTHDFRGESGSGGFPIKITSKFFHLTNSLTFAFPKKQGDILSVFSSLYCSVMAKGKYHA